MPACKNCGCEMSDFDSFCPACGREVKNEVSNSLQEFAKTIEEYDQEIAKQPRFYSGWSSWSKNGKIIWVVVNICFYCIPLIYYFLIQAINAQSSGAAPMMSNVEKQKAIFIENATLANDRECILDSLLYIKAKMRSLESEGANNRSVYWSKVWFNKATQIHDNSLAVLGNDKIADETYAEIVESKNNLTTVTKKKGKKATGLLIGLTALLILGLFIPTIVEGISDKIYYANRYKVEENFTWPENDLTATIPEITGKPGNESYSYDQTYEFYYKEVSQSEFNEYSKKCIEYGYEEVLSQESYTFEAYNADGYKLDLSYDGDLCVLQIRIEGPIEMSEITWPTVGLAALIPKPESNVGAIDSNSSSYFSIYIGNTTKDAYMAYVDTCIKYGFNVDYHQYDTYFHGKNSNGVYLSVSYEGYNTMVITCSE